MSFKLFIYYCAVWAAWGAFAGWLLGWALTPSVEDPETALSVLSNQGFTLFTESDLDG